MATGLLSVQAVASAEPASPKDHHVKPTFFFPTKTFKNPWPSDLPPTNVLPHAFWRPEDNHQDFTEEDEQQEIELELKENGQSQRRYEEEEHPVRCIKWSDTEERTGGQAQEGNSIASSVQPTRSRWGKKEQGKVRSCWLGHASVLVMVPLRSEGDDEVGVLFDPVFEERCSPSGFVGPVRDISPPCDVKDLPPIHVVLISHSHYDHLSLPTTQALWAIHKAHIRWIVPLGLKSWFKSVGIPEDRVSELDWWDQITLSHPSSISSSSSPSDSAQPDSSVERSLRVACTPCQHGSGRSGWDKSTSLWCSWAVGVEEKERDGKSTGSKGKSTKDWDNMPCTIYFAGDTGYRQFGVTDPKYICPAFSQTASTLTSSFSLLFLPISPGSSLPYLSSFVPYPFSAVSNWITDEMVNLGVLTSGVHMTPGDAVELMGILGKNSGTGVAIHWGTWGGRSLALLTKRWLWSEMRKMKMPHSGPGGFELWNVGEWKVTEWKK
ncbi:Predicted Zn-dependent hydrolase (beta-lactamase superfamily) [Phaffia rhodozyma]|uniref:Predicted Zn-dependent hydrolase (Beta-lactamase superfamily) n=1 Tax=Phaffia rhodozyma TaxID=264483 RepID=A0A0F7SG18_PHARH|nr:Predicted Zn-dependent hydrolase (beta-lactamase superfamily) [Phaffia rhodozyma]